MTVRMEISGLLISSHGFSSRGMVEAVTRMGGAAMGFGEASNCGGELELPVLRRESPVFEELEVALRDDPVRSSLGGGTEGVHE